MIAGRISSSWKFNFDTIQINLIQRKLRYIKKIIIMEKSYEKYIGILEEKFQNNFEIIEEMNQKLFSWNGFRK